MKRFPVLLKGAALFAALALVCCSCSRTAPSGDGRTPDSTPNLNTPAVSSAGVSPYAPVTDPPEGSPPASPDAGESHIKIAFAGDVLLYGRVASALESGGYDAVIEPELADYLSRADMCVVNLEMALSNRGTPMEDKQFTFRGKPGYTDFLKHMGVDAVSLANNHALDYGRDALLDTMSCLSEAGIGYAGAGADIGEASAPLVYELKGKRIAILAASRVIPVTDWNATAEKSGMLTTYDPARLNAAIAAAKEDCDHVVVFVHWGVESQNTPEDYQIKLAKGYIDAGADAVIGSHPHIMQGFEIYDGSPIAYSLGNFIFTSSRPETCVAVLNITPDDLWLDVLPCTIESPYTSRVLDRDTALSRLRALEEISFGVRFDDNGRLFAE